MKLSKIPNLPRLKMPVFGKPIKIGVIFLFVIFGLFLYFHFIFLGRIYPNVYIAGINVGGQTQEEAQILIKNYIYLDRLVLTKDNEEYEIFTDSIKLKYDHFSSVENALNYYSPSQTLNNLFYSLASPFTNVNIPLSYTIDEEALLAEIDNILPLTKLKEPVYPGVSYDKESIIIEYGSPGEGIDKDKLVNDIKDELSSPSGEKIVISLTLNDPTITQEQAVILTDRANILLDKSVVFVFENSSFTLSENDILGLLSADGGYKKDIMEESAKSMATEIERAPQNPVFVFSGGKVTEFAPAKDGIALDENTFLNILEESLKELEEQDKTTITHKIPTINTPPDYTTSDVNDLGIKELIGRGTSKYAGSIATRVHNIAHASSHFNGVLLKPGETFSFNQTLGEVSDATGYQQAYIIKDGRTELGDGGGVCQVSTTLFRAILDAGLPITERRAHSYRVTYYEQGSPPGLDATVYEPSPDLKFRNDTPGHLLIQAVADTKARTLVFEIYGTSDGRVSSITKSVVTGVTPPPEDLYIDDPTLPVGTVKQIDWKAWGAKVTFDYTVERGGETLIKETYYSNYKPWQAKFLRGTGPVQ